MEDYRQPVWAFLVILLWLASGVVLLGSLGGMGTATTEKIVVGAFLVVTVMMARAVHVLMDREEKRFPLWAMGVVLVTAAVIAAILLV